MDGGMFMRFSSKLVGAFLALSLFTVCPKVGQAEEAEEAEKALTLDNSVAFLTDYMFRGFNLYDGTSIQPTTTLSFDTGFGVISGNLWMHLSAEGDRQAEKFTELDETISYAYTFGSLTAKTGFLWYTYPNSDDDINDTSEFFAGLSLDDSEMSPFSLSPSLTYYRDYREFLTSYFELTLSHEIETDAVGKGFNVTPYVTLGFNDGGAVYEDDGLEFIATGVSFAATLGDISLTPSLNYSFEIDDATTNEFWVSVAFGYSL